MINEKQEPLKWTKYRIGHNFGIVNSEVFNNITRYDISEYPNCLKKISSMPNNSKFNLHRIMFVSQDETNSLPFTFGLDEQKSIKLYNSLDEKSKYTEVWHYRNYLAQNCYCGRLLFVNGEQIVELLTEHNYRKLNEIPDVQGYVRLERKNNDTNFKIKQVIAKTSEGKELAGIADIIGRKLEYHTVNLEKFVRFVKSHGAGLVNFDFVFMDNNIRFFDWDCGNEEKVLAVLKHPKNVSVNQGMDKSN